MTEPDNKWHNYTGCDSVFCIDLENVCVCRLPPNQFSRVSKSMVFCYFCFDLNMFSGEETIVIKYIQV